MRKQEHKCQNPYLFVLNLFFAKTCLKCVKKEADQLYFLCQINQFFEKVKFSFYFNEHSAMKKK